MPILMGIAAMVLIYAVTANLPKIAAFVDKLRGQDGTEHRSLYDTSADADMTQGTNGSDADDKENKNG